MNNSRSKLVLAIWGATALLSVSAAHAQSVPAQISALQAQVAALQAQVNSLQAQLAGVQSNHALLLGPFVNVDPNPEIGVIGPNIIFSGANIHIVSGSGTTNDLTGLGNLIIGYDEDPVLVPSSVALALPLAPDDRGGSHNLVIGRWNRFRQYTFGGIVAGEVNTISGEACSITGGVWNEVLGYYGSVSGGYRNRAWERASSVSGGELNIALAPYATVSGGDNNVARGMASSFLGGMSNSTDGSFAVTLGGRNISSRDDLAIVPQPPSAPTTP